MLKTAARCGALVTIFAATMAPVSGAVSPATTLAPGIGKIQSGQFASLQLRRAAGSQGPAQESVMRLKGGKKAQPAVGRVVLDKYTHEIKSKNMDKPGFAKVEVTKDASTGKLECFLETDMAGLWIHWGFAKRDSGWFAPPAQYIPDGSKKIDDKAHQTPFNGGKIHLSVDMADAPEAIAFVLKKDSPEEWFNGPGGDFWVAFKPADPSGVGQTIVDRESKSTHWTILNRMSLVVENLKPVAESPGGLAWLYTILRFNFIKLVPLSIGGNYQSKDLAHCQKGVSTSLSALYAKYPGGFQQMWSRMMIALVPRGGGNGDAIRLEILDIMRRHGIKEGHRPGIEDKFIEEWHQKLHTNCAPDDIVIAEAYIKFLQSGNKDDYWGHLKAKGLSWEYMCSIGGGKGSANSGLKGMTASPMHLPQLTDDIKHLKWTLMQVHGGADIDFMIYKAKDGLSADIVGLLTEIQQNRHEWWVTSKIIEARSKLRSYCEQPDGHRDALMLDVALEGWFGVQLSKSKFGEMDRDAQFDLASTVLHNVALSYGGEWWKVLSLFNKVRDMGDRWSPQWAAIAKATTERASLALQAAMDQIHTLVQPKARELGTAIGTDESYLANFAEETIRGLPTFHLSQILACIDPEIRKAGNMGAWEQVTGVPSATGEVATMDDLVGIQGKSFDTNQVVIVKNLGGIEDIPAGVVAVLSHSAVDVLSHIAIRARNQGVLMATCHDEGVFNALMATSGVVDVKVDARGQIEVTASTAAAGASSKGKAVTNIKLKPIPAGGAMVVSDAAFSETILGGKSNNLQVLRKATGLPSFLKFPSSVALPFGTCEKALADPANSEVKSEVDGLVAKLSGDAIKDSVTLAEIREAMLNLEAPAGMEKELEAACAAAKFDADLFSHFEDCFDAIKQVWASKWTDRAFFSRKACGVPDASLSMAVLGQQVVAAEYAFVLHTTNPISGATDEMMGEVVVGLGESLVGNYPGRALTFTINKASGAVTVLRLPSKRQCLKLAEDTLIFRSDSNGEDLEGFAGAGLYESILVTEANTVETDYEKSPLLFDESFRKALISKLAEVGKAVEGAMGSAQDIEGCVVGEDVTVVQTRPQV